MPPNSPLPIVATLREAVLALFDKKTEIGYSITPWIFALIFVDLLINSVETQSNVLGILFACAEMVFVSLLAINIHRIILIGDESVPKYGIGRWTSRETRFLGWCVVADIYLILVSGAVVFLGMSMTSFFDLQFENMSELLAYSFAAFGALLGWILFARLSLLLPATAVGKREHMGWAFDASKGNSIRLALLIGILPAVFLIFGAAILQISEAGWAMFLVNLVYCASIVIGVAVLSTCYRRISEPVNSESN